MGFFDLFRRGKKELPIEALKWNKMWDMWAEQKASSPYAQLMTYESEINNGGHKQFFDNVSVAADLSNTVAVLYTVLGDVLQQNLKRAYEAFLQQNEDTLAQILDECDNVFYENESEVEKILKDYAMTIEV
ncbi:MAG: DUF4375 domain-containing protein [Clostridiales bacterium]|nr:DUF4375 domain-containing protein [Clostridiales bacterium]